MQRIKRCSFFEKTKASPGTSTLEADRDDHDRELFPHLQNAYRVPWQMDKDIFSKFRNLHIPCHLCDRPIYMYSLGRSVCMDLKGTSRLSLLWGDFLESSRCACVLVPEIRGFVVLFCKFTTPSLKDKPKEGREREVQQRRVVKVFVWRG